MNKVTAQFNSIKIFDVEMVSRVLPRQSNSKD
jgi:hypothetical protein